MDSVFEVTDDNGQVQLRKNVVSKVVVGSTSQRRLSFRNPPHVILFTSPELRDTHYETDAAIDHYFVSRISLLAHCRLPFCWRLSFSSTVFCCFCCCYSPVSSQRGSIPDSTLCPAVWDLEPVTALRRRRCYGIPHGILPGRICRGGVWIKGIW